MAILNLDFSSVPNREPLEPGWYHGRIAKVEEKMSSTGKPMLAVEYDVIGTEEGEEIPGNRKLFENWVLTDAALWKVQAVFKALDLPTEAIVDLDTEELIGMELFLKVVQETYQGEVRNQVKACKAIQ